MAFNFDQAIKEAEVSAKSTALEAIILGPSGAGKSSVMGTTGLKTLFLYTGGESHGIKSAQARGKNVMPVRLDVEDGKQLTADETYARLLTILNDVDGIRKSGFKFIGVDGCSELELIIRQTTNFKKLCLTPAGKHNTYAEMPATLETFRPIMNALKNLQRELNVHFAMSLILDVKDMGPNGEYLEAAPRLKGYSVAEGILQQFGDILVVGKMTKGNEAKYKFQFMTELTKVSKDEAGNLKKAMNFSPRLSGLSVPPIMDADLSQVISLKEAGGIK